LTLRVNQVPGGNRRRSAWQGA